MTFHLLGLAKILLGVGLLVGLQGPSDQANCHWLL